MHCNQFYAVLNLRFRGGGPDLNLNPEPGSGSGAEPGSGLNLNLYPEPVFFLVFFEKTFLKVFLVFESFC